MNLVTGVTGFVGSWVLKTAPKNTLGSRHLELAGNPKRIIHCAWANSYIENILMVEQILDYCEKNNCKFTFISSGAVRFEDKDEYAETKRDCEKLCEGHTILRLYSFIGLGLNKYAPYQFLKEAMARKDIIISGTGEAIRSYLYAQQMGELVWQINLPGTFDLGSKVPITIKELADKIANMYGVKVHCLGNDDGPHKIYLPKAGVTPYNSLDEQLELRIRSL